MSDLEFVCVECGNEIKIKYMDTSMKCPMCKRFQEQKNIKVYD
jgi:DNA-directed RNA polymerase subunit RPC12/RpoP